MAKSRILVVGYEQKTSRTICWVLEYKGHKARPASGPEAAIEALIEKNYDLVIAEFGNGSGDNLRVLRRAKQLNPRTRIILMNDNQSPLFPLEAYCLEVDDYLLMPISPTELWRRVSRCLEPAPDLRLGETTEDRFISLTRRGDNFAQEIPVG